MVGFSDGIVDFYDEPDFLSGVTFHPYGKKVLQGLNVQASSGELTVRSIGGRTGGDTYFQAESRDRAAGCRAGFVKGSMSITKPSPMAGMALRRYNPVHIRSYFPNM